MKKKILEQLEHRAYISAKLEMYRDPGYAWAHQKGWLRGYQACQQDRRRNKEVICKD